MSWPIPLIGSDELASWHANISSALISLRAMFTGAAEPATPTANQLWANLAEVKQRSPENDRWKFLWNTNGGPVALVGRWIDYTDEGVELVVADVPAGFIPLRSGAFVQTVFDGDGGGNLLEMGWNPLRNEYIANLDATVAGYAAGAGAELLKPESTARQIVARYFFGGTTAATAGRAFVWVEVAAIPPEPA